MNKEHKKFLRSLKFQRYQARDYRQRVKLMARSCCHIEDVLRFKFAQKHRKGKR